MSKIPDKFQQQHENPFTEAVAGIKPLTQDKIVPSTEKKRMLDPQKNFQENDFSCDNLSDEYDPFENEQQRNDLNFHHPSFSKRQFIALKKRSYQIDLILDLHGLNRQQARQELQIFLEHCHHHGYKQVAIMPGQGQGILRQSLNRWLRQIPEIIAYAESPESSGGKGVIRVLLTHR